MCRAFRSFAFCQRFAHVIVCCSNLQYIVAVPEPGKQMCKHVDWSRVRFQISVVPPCDSGARVLRLKVRNSQGDSKVLLLFFFFFFATERATICRVGSFPTVFPWARVVCGCCDIVIYVCLRRCWIGYLSRFQPLECNWKCVLGCTCKLFSSRGCWHRGRLFSLYRVLWWRPGYFVSVTMGCVVVTEPFDLTSLVEGARSPFQIGCKPILTASASQHGWAHY